MFDPACIYFRYNFAAFGAKYGDQIVAKISMTSLIYCLFNHFSITDKFNSLIILIAHWQ